VLAAGEGGGVTVRILTGDCLEMMTTLAGEGLRVDAVVTDPPYHLTSGNAVYDLAKTGAGNPRVRRKTSGGGFMGKKWDGGNVAFRPETWRLAFDLLKPGGHLLAFGGTRTYHRLACAVEDAGFEIRDQLQWLFGSGFPKSHDVGKAIDKRRDEDAAPIRCVCRFLRSALDRKGLKSRNLTQHFDGCHPRLIDHWAARDTDSQPALPTWDQWLRLKQVLCFGDDMDAEVWRLNGRKGQPGDAYQEAEILGEHGGDPGGFAGERFSTSDGLIRATATDAAKDWQGWGTALKPACEPIVLARKPLHGTVAANVLKHGTGALNIDRCRVSSSTGQRPNGDEKWEQDQRLCNSCVDHVAKKPKHGTRVTRAFTATNDAEPILNEKDDTNLLDTGKTAIGCSDGTKAADTAINLSTDADGKRPTDQCQPAMSSTTLTKTSPTTASRICSLCGAEITALTTGENISAGKKSLQPDANRQGPTGQGSEPSGRWPANIVHDGSDEVLAAFAVHGELTSGKLQTHHRRAGKSQIGTFDIRDRTGEPCDFGGDTGTAARFFYSAKADASDRLGSKHPTVKPVDLMRWLVRLVTPPGGLVLDPFAGTGTTGMACLAEGFSAILIEREAEYVADIERRIAHVSGGDTPLFKGAAQ
jgi:DNA modification methylase